MAEEKKPVRTGRERLAERFGRTHPDRKFEGETADNDIESLAADELDRYENESNEYNTRSKQIADLFDKDTRFATMLKRAAAGEDPFTYFIENFGDDFLEAMKSEEGKKKFADAHQKYVDKLAAQEKATQEYDKNISKSIGETLPEFAKEKNLSDDDAADLFLKLHQIMLDAENGIYTKESFQMVYNASNYDKDVAMAREDGEVEGRNARIRRELKESSIRNQAVPSLGGSTSGRVAEQRDQRRRDGGLPMFGIPANNK